LPIVLLLIALVLVLVWFGVSRGLRLLDPLTEQIAERRARDLSPLDQSVVPVEIRSLTQTIDALFARLRDLRIQRQDDRQDRQYEHHHATDADHAAIAFGEIFIPCAHQAPALRICS
jgi:hypothetical protein